MNASWSWKQTRELYTDWAALWPEQSGLKEALLWRGYPLWWSSNLIAKDTAVDYHWYQELHNRLSGRPETVVKPISDVKIYCALLGNFLKEICKWLLVKCLPAAKTDYDQNIVWFHGLEYNLLDTGEGFCDRMYEQTFLDDRKYKFTSVFVIRLFFKKQNFYNPCSWRRRIVGLSARLRREVVVLDRYLVLGDIVHIHYSLVKNYFKFKKLIKPINRKGVYIAHANFTDILFREFQISFISSIPHSLIYAAMFDRWLKAGGGTKAMVTYAETLAPMRPVYFFTKKHSIEHCWVSIQHATIYKNKMGFYHRFSEFNQTGFKNKRLISSMPDYYFVHGLQFADILAEFFPPERIRVIGCLKYDRLHRLYSKNKPLRHRSKNDRMLLLAPSVGDENIILKMFSGLSELPGWRVMLSRHPAVSQERIEKMVSDNSIALSIEFDLSKSTAQLIDDATLVICSYSSIAFESHFMGVPSLRVLNPEQPPIVEDELGIKYISTQKELLLELSARVYKELKTESAFEISDTLDYYFYRFDGLASQRFWKQLDLLLNNASEAAV